MPAIIGLFSHTVLNKPCEKLEIKDERDQEKDQEVEKDRDIDRGPTHGL